MARVAVIIALVLGALVVADAAVLAKGKGKGNNNNKKLRCPDNYDLTQNVYGALCTYDYSEQGGYGHSEQGGYSFSRDEAVLTCADDGAQVCTATQFLKFNLPLNLEECSTYWVNNGGWVDSKECAWQRFLDGYLHKPVDTDGSLEFRVDGECLFNHYPAVMVFNTDSWNGFEWQTPDEYQNRLICCLQLEDTDAEEESMDTNSHSTASTHEHEVCTNGFSEAFDGSCYKFSNNDNLNLFEAIAYCDSVDAKLCPVEKAADLAAFASDLDCEESYWVRGTFDVAAWNYISWGPVHNFELYCTVSAGLVQCKESAGCLHPALCCL